jgi:predicted AlkP superfamily phosphohydrolase/phosphomutase
MSIRASSRKVTPSGKVFVLSLDGVSHAFLRRHCDDGLLPSLSKIMAQGDLREMETVRPAVSLVAWASYMTGKNPGRHGVYGFVDRRPGTAELFVPNGKNVAGPALWEVLSRAGRQVVVINVPPSYPPRPVNGVLVSGLLSPSLDEATYPAGVSRLLKGMNYRIDADLRIGKTDREAFLGDLDVTLRKRFESAALLMKRQEWDFFQLHVMETDRINHLLWGDYEEEGSPYREAFLSFYRTFDDLVGELAARLPPGCDVVILSDHGFGRLKKEVYLNRFLEERDWLEFERRKPLRLSHMVHESKAYSLTPGRIYLNLRGREPQGSVSGKDGYRGYREGLRADLLGLRDPDTGEEVAAEVLRGEEVNGNPAWGPFPVPVSEKVPAPCDLLVVPREGYDLKGALDGPALFARGALSGAHTSGGAFVYLRGRTIAAESPHLLDIYPTILDMMGVETEEELEGRTILREVRAEE